MMTCNIYMHITCKCKDLTYTYGVKNLEVENPCVKNCLFHFILNFNIKFRLFERYNESENA